MTPAQKARYDAMIEGGESHNIAEVLAIGAFPGFVTDDIFMAGRKTGDQFDGCREQGKLYHRMAESAGVATSGKYYSAPLASYPGDPTGWISDRSDALRVARSKGLKLEGLVNYTPPEHEPTPDIPIARDILDRRIGELMSEDPSLRYDDAHERSFNQLTGREDSHPLLVEDHVPPPVDGLE